MLFVGEVWMGGDVGLGVNESVWRRMGEWVGVHEFVCACLYARLCVSVRMCA